MSFQYYPFSSEETQKRSIVWEALAEKRPFGGLAVALPSFPDAEEVKKDVVPVNQIPLAKTALGRNELWDQYLRKDIHHLLIAAASKYQCDAYPALNIPRPIHRQSQGLAEIFGCSLEEVKSEPDLFHPIPCIHEPSDVDRIKVIPFEQTAYGNAVKYARYAYEATEGMLSVKNPVMTGPIDTVNYIMGTMTLMEWIYDYPNELHTLLRIVTEQLIKLIKALQKVTDNHLCPDHSFCLPRGYALCSEVRHMISKEAYDEFEAPYLRQIGKECGPYVYHSCGTFERMLETDAADPMLMLINFQTKEMDLKKVYAATNGRLSMLVGRSINLTEKYLFPDERSFYEHLFTAFPEPVPVETPVFDSGSFMEAFRVTGGGTLGSRCGIRIK